MAEKTLDARVCLKYDTYENWKSKNTILKKGEVAQTYVSSTSTIDSTGKTLTASSSGTIPAGSILYKVGDGTTAYNSLKFTTAIPTDAITKKYVDDALANKQDTITSDNTLLDTGLYGYPGSQLYNNGSGIINILSDNGIEIDATSDGEGYIAIQGTPTTKIKVHNQVYGLKIDSTNGIILGTYTNGDVDKTKPYIEITDTAVNIKGLNSDATSITILEASDA